ALHYPNVNTQGYSFRAEDMSAIGGSIYRGLVNSYIHNGCNLFNVDYELGFIYGGLFTVGYCQFIHEYAYAHELDKILFLSRDGDILKKVYDLLYPHDTYPIKTEYVYWSRLAAMKMGAGLFKHDYLRRFLYHKVNQGYSLKAVFQAMEISDMLKKCMDSIGVKTEETVLNESNVKSVKEFLINNWAEVLAHYNEELEAGREYYREVLKNCQKAAAVDVGWVGSGAVSLDKIVNKIWGFNCEITGLLAGTNTVHSAEANINEELFYTGKLKSYLFSQQHNRNLWKTHDAAKGDNLVVEMLLSSPTGGFKGFINGGFIFKNITETDQKKAGDCQKGILDFADYFIKHAPAAKVSASDAYAPIALLLNNSEYWKLVLSGEFKNANID
ncbi:MAG: hypothetical protein FWC09_10900, partial [Lachnospiraceae bacterium]|nr:hypothetical protein [Lachnospiraceae bacterium]